MTLCGVNHCARFPRVPLLTAAFFVFAIFGAAGTGGAQIRPANVSGYQARMNSGYRAARAGNQLAAAAAFDSAAQMQPTNAEALVAAGYAYLAARQNVSAISRFNSAVIIEPDRDLIRRQLGYLYAAAGDNRSAIAAFAPLLTRGHASAQDYLALGNLHAMIGQRDSSLKFFRSAFELATQIGDTTVSAAAQKSIGNLANASAPAAGAFVEYYLSPFYQHRFDNAVGFGFVHAGVSGTRWKPQLYLSLRATRDSKSVGGLQPVLFADNSVIPALGARVSPASWLTLYAEAGAAYPLVSVALRHWHRDLRAGLITNLASTQLLLKKSSGIALVSELYGDVSWYERFNRDIIGYAQWRESLRLLQGRAGSVDVFGRLWGTTDSRRDYYNRAVEGGGGIALHVGTGQRVTVYVEAMRGHYLSVPTATQRAQGYSDFRVTFVTGMFRQFAFAKP